MNTHDKYELPTLPEPFTYIHPGKSEGALYHTGHMQDYVLADRKKFGRNENDQRSDNDNRKRKDEPVAWAMFSDDGNIRLWSKNPMPHPKSVPLYTAPQPAEPVSRDVEALVRLLEDGEWAEHVARTPLGQRLELAITTLVGEASKLHNEPVKVDAKASVPSDDTIREVFLANGFTIKPGHDDLKPYVYDAARALLACYGNTKQEK